jgi:hypothetical protein
VTNAFAFDAIERINEIDNNSGCDLFPSIVMLNIT